MKYFAQLYEIDWRRRKQASKDNMCVHENGSITRKELSYYTLTAFCLINNEYGSFVF